MQKHDIIIENNIINGNFDEFLPFVKQIYNAYGHLDGDELEIITHKELPWMEARGNKRPWESSNSIISESTMKSFYQKEYARDYAV